jgi:hypothetical protein
MKMYTIQDIRSYTRSLYAHQNEEVQIVSVNGLVAIVEAASGNRFPCMVELLSEDMVVVVVEEEVTEQINQLSLF